MQLLIARKGSVEVLEAPDPCPAENEVLLETAWSAISPGTESQALANQSGSVVSMVRRGIEGFEKIRRSLATRGWRQTLAKIEETVEKPVPLGYSISGRVVRVGGSVDDFKPGDWVTAVGPDANHATVVSVPRLLCARLPGAEAARDASVAALACVGIHALHRAELSAGDETAVVGLGVIGQFLAQALRACGHRVLALDPVETRRNDAGRCGVETHDPARFDFERAVGYSSHGQGMDAVFLCLKADSSEVLRQAAALCRKRGRLIVVGEFPVQLPRESAYEKELELRFSAAYGEGRYDPAYERLDQDYPIAQGRWTVRRNLQLFLRWLEEGRIAPSLLNPQVATFQDAPSIYANLARSESTLTLLQYPKVKTPVLSIETSPRSTATASAVAIAVAGVGRFAVETHLPNLRRAADKFDLHTLVGRSPAKTAAAAAKFEARRATCDFAAMLADPAISAVLIATPHDQHANQVVASLEAGKHVYAEKPLCIRREELERIRTVHRSARNDKAIRPVLFVGFNRRFAPLSQKLMEWRVAHRGPLSIRYLFRLAPASPEDWINRPEQGGRLIGEVCHAVDWIVWLTGCVPKSRFAVSDENGETDIFFQFPDGSRAHLRVQPVARDGVVKETVDVSQGDARWRIEDFLRLQFFCRDLPETIDAWKSKGHRESLDAFLTAIVRARDGEDPYGFLAGSALVLELAAELRTPDVPAMQTV